MNARVMEHEWSDLVHLMQEREALWRQARADLVSARSGGFYDAGHTMPQGEEAPPVLNYMQV